MPPTKSRGGMKEKYYITGATIPVADLWGAAGRPAPVTLKRLTIISTGDSESVVSTSKHNPAWAEIAYSRYSNFILCLKSFSVLVLRVYDNISTM